MVDVGDTCMLNDFGVIMIHIWPVELDSIVSHRPVDDPPFFTIHTRACTSIRPSDDFGENDPVHPSGMCMF